MTDDELTGVWTALQATPLQRRRVDARVSAWLEARDTPLVTEWLGLFKIAPIPAIGLLAASAASLVTAPPVLWLARALM